MTPRIRVTRPLLYQLAAEAGRDPKTVEQVLSGRGSDQSRAAVLGAARRLLSSTDPLVLALSVQEPPTRLRAT